MSKLSFGRHVWQASQNEATAGYASSLITVSDSTKFPTKAAAENWAVLKKAELKSAPLPKSKVVESYTMDFLLHRYIDEVYSHRPCASSKMTTINMTAEHFKDVRVIQLTPDMLFKYAEKQRAG